MRSQRPFRYLSEAEVGCSEGQAKAGAKNEADLFCACFSILLLTGCGGEEFQDLRDFVKNSGADMRGKIEPPPEVKPYEYFVYNNETNLPDPFKPRKPELRSGGARE